VTLCASGSQNFKFPGCTFEPSRFGISIAASHCCPLPCPGWQPGEGTSELIEEVHHGGNSYDPPVASFRHLVEDVDLDDFKMFQG